MVKGPRGITQVLYVHRGSCSENLAIPSKSEVHVYSQIIHETPTNTVDLLWSHMSNVQRCLIQFTQTRPCLTAIHYPHLNLGSNSNSFVQIKSITPRKKRIVHLWRLCNFYIQYQSEKTVFMNMWMHEIGFTDCAFLLKKGGMISQTFVSSPHQTERRW